MTRIFVRNVKWIQNACDAWHISKPEIIETILFNEMKNIIEKRYDKKYENNKRFVIALINTYLCECGYIGAREIMLLGDPYNSELFVIDDWKEYQLKGLGKMIMTIMNHCKKYGYSKEYTHFWVMNAFCAVCSNYTAAPHHIITRGAGGDDHADNLISLCTTHHTEIHTIGKVAFVEKYPETKDRIKKAIRRNLNMYEKSYKGE